MDYIVGLTEQELEFFITKALVLVTGRNLMRWIEWK